MPETFPHRLWDSCERCRHNRQAHLDHGAGACSRQVFVYLRDTEYGDYKIPSRCTCPHFHERIDPMAQQMNCDGCSEEIGVLLLTNLGNGDVQAVGPNCAPIWLRSMADAFDPPAPEPEPATSAENLAAPSMDPEIQALAARSTAEIAAAVDKTNEVAPAALGKGNGRQTKTAAAKIPARVVRPTDPDAADPAPY